MTVYEPNSDFSNCTYYLNCVCQLELRAGAFHGDRVGSWLPGFWCALCVYVVFLVFMSLDGSIIGMP